MPRLFKTASFLLDYPFASRLYPGALDVIGIWRLGARQSFCRTATWSSNRAR